MTEGKGSYTPSRAQIAWLNANGMHFKHSNHVSYISLLNPTSPWEAIYICVRNGYAKVCGRYLPSEVSGDHVDRFTMLYHVRVENIEAAISTLMNYRA